jgi:hypothetical protein
MVDRADSHGSIASSHQDLHRCTAQTPPRSDDRQEAGFKSPSGLEARRSRDNLSPTVELLSDSRRGRSAQQCLLRCRAAASCQPRSTILGRTLGVCDTPLASLILGMLGLEVNWRRMGG